MYKLALTIDPVAKPRMTRADRWKKRPCVVRYRAYSNRLREAALLQKYVPANELIMQFHIKMPVSWSKKKKEQMRGKPMQSRPDIDNLQKSILDSLFPDEDSAIWKVCASKRWADVGSVTIKNWDEIVIK
jgi:Holliday junction resolvase RusA-like endonuclease